MKSRRSGILLHITSLPSPYGIGDLGPDASRFVDFLTESGQCLWQILPLNPTCMDRGHSPYNSHSAFAGNPLLISPDYLTRDGYVNKSDIQKHPSFPPHKVNYASVCRFKEILLRTAFKRHRERIENDSEFHQFRTDNDGWLDDYSLFVAVRRHLNGTKWSAWPEELRGRRKSGVKKWRQKMKEEILREDFSQFLFYKQWKEFRDYCRERNIQIVGDIPIYVHYDSSDVWAHPDLFKLNRKREMTHVAGVPPDYFSATGQLWGNPVYDWDALKKKQYKWWIRRLEHNFKLCDIARIDHFRGFVGYWEVSASEKTALNGRWVEAPARDFFSKILRHFTSLPIIAEDLGVITPDVREVMSYFGFPGMRLLLFAFGEDNPDHPYLPHNFPENCIVYTGTHDNNTVAGWFRREARPEDIKRVSEYLGRKVTAKTIHWDLIRLALSSVARTAIFPAQDILGLGISARMNLPSTGYGNWRWRLEQRHLTPSLAVKLRNMTERYGRYH